MHPAVNYPTGYAQEFLQPATYQSGASNGSSSRTATPDHETGFLLGEIALPQNSYVQDEAAAAAQFQQHALPSSSQAPAYPFASGNEYGGMATSSHTLNLQNEIGGTASGDACEDHLIQQAIADSLQTMSIMDNASYEQAWTGTEFVQGSSRSAAGPAGGTHAFNGFSSSFDQRQSMYHMHMLSDTRTEIYDPSASQNLSTALTDVHENQSTHRSSYKAPGPSSRSGRSHDNYGGYGGSH